jgi:hypothetical protein
MIRLPLTTIVLGRSDLREFERRRQRRREVEILDQEFSRFAAGGPDAPTFASLQPTGELAAEVELHELQTGDGQNADSQDRPVALPRSRNPRPSLEHEDEVPSSPKSSSTTAEEYITVTGLEDEGGFVAVGSQNPVRDLHRSSSPVKHDFYYDGFIQDPAGSNADNAPDRSSSSGIQPIPKYQHFLIYSAGPDNMSTPQNIRLPDTSRLRNRVPLPRSPLFLSQNASSSPEHRPTAGLTPRVESSVAIHNTPGIMFAQPARRMRRPPPRTFRHQTNSFSFDSSERASAAYEQERVTSTSTNDSTPRPSGDLRLHEDLRGSSLQSSRATSGMSCAIPDPLVNDLSTVRIQDEIENAVSEQRYFIFSSPQLPLPSPFSAVSRTVSGADILPGVGLMSQNLRASPIRSSSTTPVRRGVEGRHATPNSSPSALEHVQTIDSSPPVGLPFAP